MIEGIIITLTICFIILLAGGVSVLSTWLRTNIEIKAYRKIEENKRETIRLESDEYIKRMKLRFENNEYSHEVG